jgi:hypothetical protein
MGLYTKLHPYYLGIYLHTKKMYVCLTATEKLWHTETWMPIPELSLSSSPPIEKTSWLPQSACGKWPSLSAPELRPERRQYLFYKDLGLALRLCGERCHGLSGGESVGGTNSIISSLSRTHPSFSRMSRSWARGSFLKPWIFRKSL